MEVQELQCYRLSKNFSPLNTSDICSRDNDFTTLVLNGAHIMVLNFLRTISINRTFSYITSVTESLTEFNQQRRKLQGSTFNNQTA